MAGATATAGTRLVLGELQAAGASESKAMRRFARGSARSHDRIAANHRCRRATGPLRGITDSLLVVTTSPEHGSLLLGVAALRSDPLKKPHPVAFYVTSAIAACLLQAGDARGAAV